VKARAELLDHRWRIMIAVSGEEFSLTPKQAEQWHDEIGRALAEYYATKETGK